ncbi:hypothetical protein BD289DRAFT_292194 [Coniella lustricola]|uniref:Uncharacterized protein n=1 Tax=Coniella lustricola TaxID=2025994 RepID=A0A2T3A584_9PEZI|nr:hypothetical protein BD289DRAFT_292194 [Coniella lustricola]
MPWPALNANRAIRGARRGDAGCKSGIGARSGGDHKSGDVRYWRCTLQRDEMTAETARDQIGSQRRETTGVHGQAACFALANSKKPRVEVGREETSKIDCGQQRQPTRPCTRPRVCPVDRAKDCRLECLKGLKRIVMHADRSSQASRHADKKDDLTNVHPFGIGGPAIAHWTVLQRLELMRDRAAGTPGRGSRPARP